MDRWPLKRWSCTASGRRRCGLPSWGEPVRMASAVAAHPLCPASPPHAAFSVTCHPYLTQSVALQVSTVCHQQLRDEQDELLPASAAAAGLCSIPAEPARR